MKGKKVRKKGREVSMCEEHGSMLVTSKSIGKHSNLPVAEVVGPSLAGAQTTAGMTSDRCLRNGKEMIKICIKLGVIVCVGRSQLDRTTKSK